MSEVEREETPAEAMHRLEAEGRWAEASKFRIRYIRTQRELGRQGKDVNKEAERVMRERFPPLTPEQIANRVAKEVAKETRLEERLGGGAEETPIAWKIPKSWGVLPETAAYRDEVEWVHQQRVVVIEQRAGKQAVINLKNATRPAPSKGALALLEDAAVNRAKFMEITKGVLGGGESEDGEAVKREKRSLKEIEAILEKMEAST